MAKETCRGSRDSFCGGFFSLFFAKRKAWQKKRVVASVIYFAGAFSLFFAKRKAWQKKRVLWDSVILYSLLTVLETSFIIKIYMDKGGLKWKIEINYKSA
ncbi:MAG: hypothetical protein IJD59_00350 [Clostridia bacterium]|nr:hypothetical protein [Clostridia bacterium]